MADTRFKELEAAEEELARRRERGKLAQRAFRKRQNQASRDLREENRRMRAAIEELVGLAAPGDRPELCGAIRKAASAAGVDAQGLLDDTATTPASNSDDRRQNLHTGVENHSVASTSSSSITSEDLTTSASSDVDAQIAIQLGLAPAPYHTEMHRSSSHGGSPLGNGTDVGPVDHYTSTSTEHLDRGLWNDEFSFLRVVDPPPDIVPYLGEGMFTLAGRVMWACADYLMSVCRRAAAVSSSPSEVEAALRRNPQIQQLFPNTPRNNMRLIRAMTELRLEFRQRGLAQRTCDGQRPAKLVQRHVELHYAQQREENQVWVDPTGVAQHVRLQLGDKAFERLEALLRHHDGNGDGSAVVVAECGEMLAQASSLLRLLIQNLAESFICLGDGPRWRADLVGSLFSAPTRDAMSAG